MKKNTSNSKEWELNDYLNHYQQTKRFYFRSFQKSFNTKEFTKVANELKTYKTTFKHIYNNLDDIDKIEFKHDVIDNLNRLLKYQSHSKFKEVLINSIEEIKNCSEPQQIKKQETESLSDIITHERSTDIVKGIKIQYKNIKGKRLKILLLAFQDLELLPKERIAKKFHDCCRKEFYWDIASYNAMNGHDFNNIVDNDELNSMKDYLKTFNKTE